MRQYIDESINKHLDGLEWLKGQKEILISIAEKIIATLHQSKKIIFFGNGGSAADAQHLAAELVGRFEKNRHPLPAISLTTNTSILTAIANDFSFEDIFSFQIKALAQKGDLAFCLSTSGNSKNIIQAIKVCQDKNIYSIGFLGRDGGILANQVNKAFVVPLKQTARIQEIHILAGHIICGLVENEFCKKNNL